MSSPRVSAGTPRGFNTFRTSIFRRQGSTSVGLSTESPLKGRTNGYPGQSKSSSGSGRGRAAVSEEVAFSDEYSEQIEYNNQLLQQLQQAELKNQERTRQLTERDQEVRNLRHEIQLLKQEVDHIKEESYREKLTAQQTENELEHYQQQMEELQRDKRHYQQEQDQLLAKLENSLKLVSYNFFSQFNVDLIL